MKLWVARNEDGTLTLHKIKPKLFFEEGIGTYWTGSNYYLPTLSFPEVTFENSPQEVEIKLTENERTDKEMPDAR